MSYIRTRARKFVQDKLIGGGIDHKEIISDVRSELYEIHNDSDKVIFITTVLEQNQIEYQNHQEHCTKGPNCDTNYEHESITYYLTGELGKLGVRTDNDQFTVEEKDYVITVLESMKKDLETIKDGQQIIFEELELLKEYFILGKKTWSQLFMGKFTEMTLGGIISETVSKQVISTITSINFNQLLTTG